jgi:sulfate adenylyltransferase subunit 1
MDLVGYDQKVFTGIRAAFAEFAADLSYRDVIYIPMSALKGDMVVERGSNLPWYDGAALLELLDAIAIDDDLNLEEFRFPVQWVCRPGGDAYHDFRGYMGRIESGTVSTGDVVTVLPAGRSSRVKQIVTFDGAVDHAFAPQSVTLLLEDDIDISRGDMIVKNRDSVRIANDYAADICWLSEQPLDIRRKYLVKHTTKTTKVWLTRIEHRVDVDTSQLVAGLKSLQMNDLARVGIRAQHPLVIDSYARNRATGSFILIDEASNTTVAAGMIA